jgi:hypothetical protein
LEAAASKIRVSIDSPSTRHESLIWNHAEDRATESRDVAKFAKKLKELLHNEDTQIGSSLCVLRSFARNGPISNRILG